MAVTRRVSVSVIAADVEIGGSIKAAGELHIDGTVKGDITAAAVTVGAGGTVEGHISADNVLVAGTVQGGIEAKELSLTRSARVRGKIRSDVMTADIGAVVELEPPTAPTTT